MAMGFKNTAKSGMYYLTVFPCKDRRSDTDILCDHTV